MSLLSEVNKPNVKSALLYLKSFKPSSKNKQSNYNAKT